MPAAKISREIIVLITKTLKDGNYRKVACKLAGIDSKTLANWMKRGERECEWLYGELFESASQAEVQSEAYSVMLIKRVALKSWMAVAWMLERKWPERWGRREVPTTVEKGMDSLMVIG